MNKPPLPRDRAILAHHTDGKWIPVKHHECCNCFIHIGGDWNGFYPESDFDSWQELDWDTVWELV